MRKEIILGLLAAGVVLSPAVSLAEENNAKNPASTSPEHRLGKPFKDIREEYREKIKDFKASTTEVRKEARADIKNATSSTERQTIRREWIKARIEVIIKRLNAALERSEKFIERLTTLLNNKEEEGKDVTSAEAKLETAKNKLDEAETAIGKIMPAVNNVLASTTITKDAPGIIREAVKDGVEAVKAAHQAIVDVLRALKN
ncbi:MAG: hypothetical protein KBC48_02820 [Candidatus Pacebacteria bacterium]|nr:hypothetical protein [Candidatus Paceibacterota bacterium]